MGAPSGRFDTLPRHLEVLVSVWYMYSMAQLNINQTPEFEEDLQRLMSLRNYRSKSEAVRLAVKECVARALESGPDCNFSEWLGLAKQDENPQRRFMNHSEIWD